MKIPVRVLLNGKFSDQCGLAERGPIVGRNGDGIRCRRYTWINPLKPELKDKTFEALKRPSGWITKWFFFSFAAMRFLPLAWIAHWT